MVNDYRCLHSRTPDEQESAVIDQDTTLEGVVVCQHAFGIGVYVSDRGQLTLAAV